ncbi:MAG: hypothetical protein JSU01_03255 [Bacteroidetes bacterium]|nr:hypothetical protein [Bacteroidota bacterium]
MKVEFESIGEIMVMSGPWAVYVKVDGRRLKGRFIEQKIVTDENQHLLILPKIIEFKQLLIKKIEFGIYVLDTTNNKEYLSKVRFHYLYIDGIHEKNITYFEAFHDKTLEKKRIRLFDKSSFDLIDDMI